MSQPTNPFHELYLTESITSESFVKLFSPFLVRHALALFQPGNVILKGLPGSGKSMLLNLLKPELRLAYAKAGEPFPVPKNFSRFIGAGINLNRSGAVDFGQQPVERDNLETTPLYFGDFLNYSIVFDILQSVKTLSKAGGGEIAEEIGIHFDSERIDNFASHFAQDDCWFGYLDGTQTFEELMARLKKRVTTYRSFLNHNSPSLPSIIKKTKTGIGIPVYTTAQYLRDFDVIDPNVDVFVRIDQYEELVWLDAAKPIGEVFQSVVHRLLGLRDARVSYRIGTRQFAWAEKATMFGTTAFLENERNLKEINIDEVLQRKENRRTWTFPAFAEEIFKRRIALSQYQSTQVSGMTDLEWVFGRTLVPEKKASEYVKTKEAKLRVIYVDKENEWPKAWKRFLEKLAEADVLSARLGEAWARQRNKENIVHRIPRKRPYVWETKPWWRKERIQQALMQIASRNQQQLVWSGVDDVLGLSGGNILAFLSLCQHIWDVWIRDSHDDRWREPVLPKIDVQIQSIGIQEASKEWYEKIAKAEHGDAMRQRFIRHLGSLMYQRLVSDWPMSNPGHNGFSVILDDLDREPEVRKFLREATDFGDLFGSRHTSKTKGEKRWKWYLNPIISPYFNVPYVHTKEPRYVSITDVAEWMENAKLNLESTKAAGTGKEPQPNNGQMRLPLEGHSRD